MASRVVVPYTSASCCSRRQFSAAYQSNLSGVLTPDEFSSSIMRINAANRVGAAPMLAWIGSWFLYGTGLSIIFNIGNNYQYYGDYYGNYWWSGVGILIASIVCLGVSGRWMRTRRADNQTAAVLAEHNAFNHRGLSYRIIGAGTRNASIEIDVLAHQQPHIIAMPAPNVHHHHENIASPHYDHVMASAPVVHQQPQPVAHYQPYFNHPAPAQSPSSHPQYVQHAPPQYPQAYPQVDMRAPLIQHY